MARRAAVTAGQKGDFRPKAFGGFTTAVALATFLGSAAGTGRGESAERPGKTPCPTLSADFTDWMYSGLVEMSQAPFIQKGGTQGDSRSPDSCPLPQAQGKEASQEAALLHRTGATAAPREAAHSHSHGVNPTATVATRKLSVRTHRRRGAWERAL